VGGAYEPVTVRRMRAVPDRFAGLVDCGSAGKMPDGRAIRVVGELTLRRINEVVGLGGCGGELVSSFPGTIVGGTAGCGVRTGGAEATDGGIIGGVGGVIGGGLCKKGSGVRNAEFTERPVLSRRSGTCGTGVRNDGMLRVCGSCCSTGNGKGVRMGGGMRGGGNGGNGTGVWWTNGCDGGSGTTGFGSSAYPPDAGWSKSTGWLVSRRWAVVVLLVLVRATREVPKNGWS
jgi:hypothetical protein